MKSFKSLCNIFPEHLLRIVSFNFIYRFKSQILDLLVPAFDSSLNGGNAYFVYSHHKSVLIDNKLACPLMDPIVLKNSGKNYSYFTIGSLPKDEVIPSKQFERRVNLIELFFSLFFFRLTDFRNYKFLNTLYDSPMLCLLKRGGHWHEWRWFRGCLAIRNFILANYFSLKFRNIALKSEKAYVLVYYNAIMLGVVSAFRKLGKEAWDVQHGYLGPDHGAYSNIRAFDIPSTFIPSGFLVWDCRFGAHIESTLKLPWKNTGNHHIFPEIVSDPRNYYGFTILYTLQWGTHIPDSVQSAVMHLMDVSWIFRLHPFDDPDREDLNWIFNMSNCILSDSSESLVDSLRKCDLHITVNSGVVHESAAIGIPSIYLDEDFAVRVGHELSLGMAEYASDQSLLSAINTRIEVFKSNVIV